MKIATKKMSSWLFELDRILRGEATSPRELFRDSPKNADIRFPVGGISVVLGALGITYGACMGTFAWMRGFETGSYGQAYLQLTASMCKVPLLFVLPTAITFPSLYVFNSLFGSSLKIGPVFRLLVASFVVNLCVLASLGPIVAFFSVSSPNYSFIVLLNVLVFSLAGVLGLWFITKTLRKLQRSPAPPQAIDISSTDQANAKRMATLLANDMEVVGANLVSSVPKSSGTIVNWIFHFWMVVFALVGAQMGWVLRSTTRTAGSATRQNVGRLDYCICVCCHSSWLDLASVHWQSLGDNQLPSRRAV